MELNLNTNNKRWYSGGHNKVNLTGDISAENGAVELSSLANCDKLFERCKTKYSSSLLLKKLHQIFSHAETYLRLPRLFSVTSPGFLSADLLSQPITISAETYLHAVS